MYQLNPQDYDYGRKIQREKLLPLLGEGSAWFCSLSLARPSKSLRDEDIPKRYIIPFCLNLSRQSQSTITPFVGWWIETIDFRHHTHTHIAFHSTNPFLESTTILDEWKHVGGGYMNSIRPFDPSKEGLAYIYGKHQRRTEGFWERPFTPPKDHKTGELRKPIDRMKRFIGKSSSTKAFEPTVIRRVNSQ